MSVTPPPYLPPRNVIYFFPRREPNIISGDRQLTLHGCHSWISNSNSTVTGLMRDGPAFTDTLQSDIQLLQSAGKNVLISVGGEVNNTNPAWTGWTSAKYKIFNENGYRRGVGRN